MSHMCLLLGSQAGLLSSSEGGFDVLQITYDIYKPYVRKHASGRELLLVSRLSVAFFGLVMALVSIIFYKVSMALPPCFACCACCACCKNPRIQYK